MARNRAPSRQTRAVLRALLSQRLDWRHGYDLAKQAALSSGTLYPLLMRLHERGLLEAKWVDPAVPGRPARHAYRLSPAGVAYARRLEADTETAAQRSGSEALA